MARPFRPAVLTAHALGDGAAIWWTGAGWSARLDDARVAATPAQAEALAALGATPLMQAAVVGPYLMDVTLTDGAPAPATRRESIRAGRVPTFDYGPAAAAVERAA